MIFLILFLRNTTTDVKCGKPDVTEDFQSQRNITEVYNDMVKSVNSPQGPKQCEVKERKTAAYDSRGSNGRFQWYRSLAVVNVKHVLFPDESTFTVFPTSGRVTVWRSPKEAYHPDCCMGVDQ